MKNKIGTSRSLIISVILTLITLALMLLMKPAFPDRSAIYAVNRPIGSFDVMPGSSVDVRFTPFTDFDSVSVAIEEDSPQKEYESAIAREDDSYVLTITNPGDKVLKVITQVPGCYPGIDAMEDGTKLDIGVYKDGSSGAKIYPAIVILTCAFVFIVSFMALKGILTPSLFYLISALILGLGVYPLLYPAWSAHDADAHYQAAYRFSNILLGQGTDYIGRRCDNEFYSLAWKRFILDGGFRPDPSNEMIYPVTSSLGKIFAGGADLELTPSEFEAFERMLFYNIFNYLPLSLGIAFARLIKLAPIYMISMGRLFEGIVITAFTYRAIRMVKSERVSYALALMNLFPMSLIFITSYSYDGIVLMVVTCAAACIFRLMQKDDSPSIALIIESFIWFFLLGAVKGGGYLMFLPLVFLILRKPLRSKWNLIPLGLVLVSVASVILFDVILRPDIGFFQLGGEEGHFEASFALYHPLKYVFMCLSTLLAYSGEIFVDSIGRCEGWNEEAVPVLLILAVAALALGMIIAARPDLKVTKKTSLSLGLCCFLLLFLTPVMLLKDTPVDYVLIMGVQGRYFRPMAAFILILLAGLKDKIEDKAGAKLTLSQDKAQLVMLVSQIGFALASAGIIISLALKYLSR